ncbi:MAG TPA: hypothetical protein VFQ36_08305 [Ktedonobacteraceae bacterium]|nr:hypothetical protein [Ktedonobacteraceae bacterium]
MRMIERKDLRTGFVISYAVADSGQVWHGEIIHMGLGLASRNAVWVRCLDGYNRGNVECIMLEYVTGVTSYASR